MQLIFRNQTLAEFKFKTPNQKPFILSQNQILRL
jgi:hypothetical protein